MSTSKEVIYIDSDDDITAAIDKTTSSKAGIIALVLPKRYTTLKSSVNMKLLQKAAKKEKKKLVLITKDSSLLPLAGAAGIFVAETLKNRPAVPKVDTLPPKEDVVEQDAIDPETPVGELVDGATVEPKSPSTSSSEKSAKIKNIKESSKIKVPNFDRFRVRMALIALGVLALVVGWYVAFFVVPKANVTIQAQTSRIPTDVEFRVDPTAEADDIENNLVAGTVQEISKTVTERFEATGEKDVGQKASGTMSVLNCESSKSITVPAGTVFTDDNRGFNFVSNAAISVPGGTFTNQGQNCDPGENTVAVTAVESGDSRNLAPTGYSTNIGSGVTGFGGQMSGGTTEVVTVVSAEDIEKARQLLLRKNDENIRAELAALFDEGTVILDESFTQTNNQPSSSVPAGQEADEASISAQFTYAVVGVDEASIAQVLEKQQLETVNAEEQSILDSGVAELDVDSVEEGAGGILTVEASTVGYAGPEINTEALAEEISGMRFSEAVDYISARSGVGSVNLELTPFWVFSVPSADKVTITIEIADQASQQP